MMGVINNNDCLYIGWCEFNEDKGHLFVRCNFFLGGYGL